MTNLEESIKIDRLKRTKDGRKASFPFIGLEVSGDSSSSVSLPNGSLLEVTQKEGYPTSGTPGDRYFAIPQVSVYQDSVAAVNRIPDGSTFDLPATTTFGNDSLGADDVAITNTIRASHFTTVEGGRANSITVYLLIFNFAHKVKCAIYEYAALGNAGALVAETEEKTIAAGTIAFTTFNFTGTTPVLLPNKNYYLAVWANKPGGVNDARTHSLATTNKGISKSLTYNGWPNPMVGEASQNTMLLMYCTYIPDSRYLFEHWVDLDDSDANYWEIVFKTAILNRTGSTQTILYRGKVKRIAKGN